MVLSVVIMTIRNSTGSTSKIHQKKKQTKKKQTYSNRQIYKITYTLIQGKTGVSDQLLGLTKLILTIYPKLSYSFQRSSLSA